MLPKVTALFKTEQVGLFLTFLARITDYQVIKQGLISYKVILHYPTCPIRNILRQMSDKWSLLILDTLNQNGIMRYKGMNHAIPDISQKMLSSILKRLEE